jgi:hypothetical protein
MLRSKQDYFGSPDGNKGRMFPSNSTSSSTVPAGPPTRETSGNKDGLRLRSTVQVFLKSKLLVSSIMMNDSNQHLPEASTYEVLLEKHGEHLNRLRLSDDEVAQVLDSADQFHRIQDRLRAQNSQTDALVKLRYYDLLREGLYDVKFQASQAAVLEKKKQMAQRDEERKYKIQKELAEARIKARQALKLNNDSSNEDQDDTTTSTDEYNEDDVEMPIKEMSPISVKDFVALYNHQMLGSFKTGLTEETESEDGDIQEIFE